MSEIDEIRARLEAATSGPWYVKNDTPYLSFSGVSGPSFQIKVVISADDLEDCIVRQRWHDIEFIANAPADIAFLLEENERIKTKNLRMGSALRAIRDSHFSNPDYKSISDYIRGL